MNRSNFDNVRISSESPNISKYIVIEEPTSPDQSPSIVALERYREINIPWLDLIDKNVSDAIAPNAFQTPEVNDTTVKIQELFEAGWGSIGINDFIAALADAQRQAYMIGYSKTWYVSDVREGAPVQNEEDYLFLVHQPSKRKYLPYDNASNPILKKKDDNTFVDSTSYSEFWEQVHSVKLVGESAEQLTQSLSKIEFISRTQDQILREYAALSKLRDLSTRMAAYAAKRTAADESGNNDEFDGWWGDVQASEAGVSEYLRFSSREGYVNQLIRALAARAEAEGYYLETIPGSDGNSGQRKITYRKSDGANGEKTLEEGKLYLKSKRTVSWSVTTSVSKTRVRRGGSGRRTVERYAVNQTKYYSEETTIYEEVKPQVDPVDKYKEGLIGYQIFELLESEGGYRTASGVPAREILWRCFEDEDFRKKCALVVPKKTELVSGEEFNSGAYFFLHPLPGVFPTQFPALKLKETLAYKLQWVGTELGQLVSTLNLAPGEQRTVSVSNSFRDEVSLATSLNTSSEISSMQSEDFATELENEASKEFNRQKSSSSSGSASFSYGGFGANGSTSSQSQSNLKTFSRTLNKVARKAASSLSKKVSRSVSTTQSRTTERKADKSTSFTLSNINDGSSLNLMFYQVNNRFIGGLYLEDLQICVTESRELIEGSGIFDSRIYQLHELDEALQHFWADHLPVKLETQVVLESGDEVAAPTEKKNIKIEADRLFVSYWTSLLEELLQILKREYCRSDTSDELDKGVNSGTICFGDVDEGVEVGDFQFSADDVTDFGGLREKSDEIEKLLSQLIMTRKPLLPDNLIVASGGLFLDSLVGSLPATEPYVEKMRDLELDAKDSENDLNRARAFAIARQSLDEIGAGDVWILSVEIVPESEGIIEVWATLSGQVSEDEVSEVRIMGEKVEVQNLYVSGYKVIFKISDQDDASNGRVGRLKYMIEFRNSDGSKIIRALR